LRVLKRHSDAITIIQGFNIAATESLGVDNVGDGVTSLFFPSYFPSIL
jgi:hypothetical protein